MENQNHYSYASPRAVDQAIKAAAKKKYKEQPYSDINFLIRQAYFERFLSRIFSQAKSNWILKGGTGMLARIPESRGTRDIDLLRNEGGIEEAVRELQELVENTDLKDHFSFRLEKIENISTGDEQEYTEGRKVVFNIFLGIQQLREKISIDLVVGPAPIGPIEVRIPESHLDLPKLHSYPYRLYPLVDQIADKVCATISKYGGRDSTREKDLVDLVLIATSSSGIQGRNLKLAIDTERRKRAIASFSSVTLPTAWGRGYVMLVKNTKAARTHPRIDSAKVLIERFIDPVLQGKVDHLTWSPENLQWE